MRPFPFGSSFLMGGWKRSGGAEFRCKFVCSELSSVARGRGHVVLSCLSLPASPCRLTFYRVMIINSPIHKLGCCSDAALAGSLAVSQSNVWP
jgi:hypothetical protein